LKIQVEILDSFSEVEAAVNVGCLNMVSGIPRPLQIPDQSYVALGTSTNYAPLSFANGIDSII